jgi:hypothetical protein
MHAAGIVTEAFSDFVVGHGELWCAQLLSATLSRMGISCAFMDTRQVGPHSACMLIGTSNWLHFFEAVHEGSQHGDARRGAQCGTHLSAHPAMEREWADIAASNNEALRS